MLVRGTCRGAGGGKEGENFNGIRGRLSVLLIK